MLWWAISEPALVGPSGRQLRYRQTPAVASELLSRRRDGRAERADTDEQSTMTEPAGGTCGLCVPSSLTVNGGKIGRHITSNNRHGRYPRQDHIGQAGAWRGTSRTPPDHAGQAGARRGTSPIYVLCMTILVELVHSVPYISTLLM